MPTAKQPRDISWQDESDTAFDGRVEFVKSTGGSTGLVTNCAERLIVTARATYTPERFTLYFGGYEPLYLEGPEGGIVIADTAGCNKLKEFATPEWRISLRTYSHQYERRPEI